MVGLSRLLREGYCGMRLCGFGYDEFRAGRVAWALASEQVPQRPEQSLSEILVIRWASFDTT